MNNKSKQEFSKKLLEWWKENKQDFPWRNTKNPYKILVAEMLLRKTTARQVKKIYSKFIKTYPKASELAKASEKELETFLKTLGMAKNRSRSLKQLGITLVEKFGNEVPKSKEKLMSMLGVGRYSANAVLSLAYNKDLPMVDTNAIRVIQRFFNFKSLKKRLKDDLALWDFTKKLIPKGNGKNFNLAIIDFAHSICTLTKPKCVNCSIKVNCCYFNQ